MSLRVKFFVFLVVLFVLLGAAVSIVQAWWVDRLVIDHATSRLRQNINVAWLALDNTCQRLETIVDLLAERDALADLAVAPADRIQGLLQKNWARSELDVLVLVSPEGQVLHGSGIQGGFLPLSSLGMLQPGEDGASGYTLLPADMLALDTHVAADHVMMAYAARAIRDGDTVQAILVAGLALNSANQLLDSIQDAIFGDTFYRGERAGTVTIFMGSMRIATTVLSDSGQRAVGTTVSGKVAQQVLRRGEPWTGRALVVDEWYLSRYEPIKTPTGAVIGMLYVGELEQLYLDQRRDTVMTLVAVLLIILGLAFAVTFYARDRILRQIVALDDTTRKFAEGDLSARVAIATNDEIGELAQNFNRMAGAIEADRDRILSQSEEIQTLNSNYMQMLGFVTHELRSTISAALFNTQLLQDGSYGDLTDDLREGLSHVSNSLHYLDEITNNYLQLARIEEGALILNKTDVHIVRDVIQPVLTGLERQMHGRGMMCCVEMADDLAVPADVNLLRVVYENLIGNAIKYGRQDGHIVLIGQKEKEEGRVHLTVQNEGKAIDQSRLPSLFRKFHRYDTDESTGRQGTGLGLFIVQQIVSVHGGEVWVESSEEIGTCFHLRLPA
jgi:signal transduction histidine kinase